MNQKHKAPRSVDSPIAPARPRRERAAGRLGAGQAEEDAVTLFFASDDQRVQVLATPER